MRPPERRLFTSRDQIRFAELSGDWNPIHVDPVAARRTPYGQIVHGIHAVAWVLDVFLGESDNLGPANAPLKVKVAFLKPIGLTDEVHLVRHEEGLDRVFLVQSNTKVLISIRILPGDRRYGAECARPPASATGPDFPERKDFAGLKGEAGSLDAWGDPKRLGEEFPNLVRIVGSLRVAALLGLSRLVGMVCPGLNSIFSGLEFGFLPSDDSRIDYQVIRHSIPNAPIRVGFTGGGVEGNLDAFFRPSPAKQIGMEELRPRVRPGEFSGQTALIIGGSRGLGECMAKIIAAGGGLPIITYHLGAEDAARVAEEITRGGGKCRTYALDVRNPGNMARLSSESAELTGTGAPPSHVYYFASPAIQNNRGAGLDKALFDSYYAFYVEALERLCRAFANGRGARFFYPSTVYLDQSAAGFAEYVCAKAAGEALCGHLGREPGNLSFVVARLPRMHTDQTNSFVEKQAADPHEVLLGAARKMNLQEEHP